MVSVIKESTLVRGHAVTTPALLMYDDDNLMIEIQELTVKNLAPKSGGVVELFKLSFLLFACAGDVREAILFLNKVRRSQVQSFGMLPFS